MYLVFYVPMHLHIDFLPNIFYGITSIFGSTRFILTSPIFARANEKHEVSTHKGVSANLQNKRFAYGKLCTS
jgi:hypothetical protein